jgi:hypothetical protein
MGLQPTLRAWLSCLAARHHPFCRSRTTQSESGGRGHSVQHACDGHASRRLAGAKQVEQLRVLAVHEGVHRILHRGMQLIPHSHTTQLAQALRRRLLGALARLTLQVVRLQAKRRQRAHMRTGHATSVTHTYGGRETATCPCPSPLGRQQGRRSGAQTNAGTCSTRPAARVLCEGREAVHASTRGIPGIKGLHHRGNVQLRGGPVHNNSTRGHIDLQREPSAQGLQGSCQVLL